MGGGSTSMLIHIDPGYTGVRRRGGRPFQQTDLETDLVVHDYRLITNTQSMSVPMQPIQRCVPPEMISQFGVSLVP